MNYGPRFKSSAVSIGAHYDSYVDRNNKRPFTSFKNMDPLKQEMIAAKGRANTKLARAKISLAGPKLKPARIDEQGEASERMKERAKKAAQMLSFGVDDLCNGFAGSNKNTPNMQLIIDIINQLCTFANIPTPQFNNGRKPGMQSHRKCLDCGDVLNANETEVCSNCRPDNAAVKDASEQRRKQAAELIKSKHEAALLRQSINSLERKLRQ